MNPWVAVGIAVFVIFDAMVLILVLSLADLRRTTDDPQRMRELSDRFPWRLRRDDWESVFTAATSAAQDR